VDHLFCFDALSLPTLATRNGFRWFHASVSILNLQLWLGPHFAPGTLESPNPRPGPPFARGPGPLLSLFPCLLERVLFRSPFFSQLRMYPVILPSLSLSFFPLKLRWRKTFLTSRLLETSPPFLSARLTISHPSKTPRS